ncbi:S-adenosylmethionine:tRNA ribosyltransferase-isomerase [Actinomycetospora cinnamomea]|uniref:S-adenosylmethionine:tRNA ribosyltransferase-isomerase n=1 Tax=Actinomycetospora cinnamomea TaxID=663609 RepID=A0A2U1FFS7_9PSEU|nr:S-adenosylmethionine:tRNA ribosyltransferase-isomerase [Actinomycetospora cinnamomea]PVZ11065.1 S-adenosylmethionine:tRNA ribosyltransferase-isomerase [Actinomycetospora cinnamomea]
MSVVPATRFVLPAGAEAHEPPEHRGLARDEVRLLVARPGGVAHRRFLDLADVLEPGDLLVVNTSATLAAALDARHADGRAMTVHVATALDDGTWVVEPRRPDGPERDVAAGDRLELPGVALTLVAPYPDEDAPRRLWRARPWPPVGLVGYLARYGRPIAYGHLGGRFPLADHQTVYATLPGSAEMPSAGRPLSERLLVRLVARGVTVAPLVLHAGVSSPEKHEPPTPERFSVPSATARLVNSARDAGARVVAVGTTVVRALETVATPDGTVSPGHGWTDLVLGTHRPARTVTGLVSGLHEPEASHLALLEAVAGPELVGRTYEAAVREGYLWHEFGDSTLLLPTEVSR